MYIKASFSIEEFEACDSAIAECESFTSILGLEHCSQSGELPRSGCECVGTLLPVLRQIHHQS